MKNIPLVDLSWQHQQIEQVLLPKLKKIMEQGNFILGSDVRSFEDKYAHFVHSKYCIGVASGTDAIELALKASIEQSKGEIIVPANTFIASIAAIIQAGYTPRLVDCDPEYWLIDTNEVLKKINHKTVGILPVHLYGQMAPMKILRDIAKTHHLALIEDGAQSQGALQDGSPVGTYSTAAATSFYPGKNLGAYGDAGAITTSNEEIATTLRQLRDHGSLVKYQHEILGTNSRLDNIQACILETKLEHLNTWNQMRRKAADYYTQLLKNVPQVQPPKVYPHNTPVWHLYVIAVNKRDYVLKLLQEKNIGAGIHYPIPTHLQNALKFLEYHPGDFPHAESIAKKIISLPLYPGITSQEQEYIIDTLRIITNE